MSPETWRRVKEITAEALELDADARAAYVRRECGSDTKLLRAVENLLKCDEEAGSQIEDAIAAAAESATQTDHRTPGVLEPGDVVSHYRIIRKLGEGGMGVVYKAHDVRLDRAVALKFMAPFVARVESVRKRFVREARSAASLHHPNICTVHEIGETGGTPFIAMSYLEGEDLAARIRGGPIEIEALLDTAIQTASALRVAHQRGLVHRDVKPANIMLTTDGRAVLMDFGLATAAGESTKITGEGARIGTSTYMAPEQVIGAEVDHRSDIWALGVVLYEMATGQAPFRAEREHAVLYSIVNETPQPLRDSRADAPPALQRIVDKCLAKSAKDRYPGVAELLVDLTALRRGSKDSDAGASSPPGRLPRPSIAVLPFENQSDGEDADYLSDGIAEAITSALGNMDRLRVAPRSMAFQFKGDRPTPRDAANTLNVGYLLQGSVRRVGSSVSIFAELIGADEGYQIWSDRYDRVIEDIFAVQEEISLAIVAKLQVKLANEDRKLLVKRYTNNLRAFNQCLRGRYYWYKRTAGAIERAVEFYTEALVEDPDYPLALSGIADCYTALAYYGVLPADEAIPRCEAAALKALRIEPDLAASHTSIGGAESLNWNWDAAEKSSLRAIELDPDYPLARLWYGINILVPMRRLEEARTQCERAAKADPVTPMVNISPVLIRVLMRDFDTAAAELETAFELEPDLPWTPLLLGLCRLNQGRYDEAIEMSRRSDMPSWVDGQLGYAYAVAGRQDEARKLIAALKAGSRPAHLVPYHLALIHFALGETDIAFNRLDEACDLRSPQLFWLNSLPLEKLDHARGDARFASILKRMNL